MTEKAIQDFYLDEFAHCYGCGRLNQNGLQIKSYWDGEETVCLYAPKPYHTGGFPGYAYGGLVASLIDCHAAATASAAKLRDDGFTLGEYPLTRFVTASMKIDLIRPTPMGTTLEIRGKIKEGKNRRMVVKVTLSAGGEIRAEGELVMVQLPER